MSTDLAETISINKAVLESDFIHHLDGIQL